MKIMIIKLINWENKNEIKKITFFHYFGDSLRISTHSISDWSMIYLKK